MGLKAACAIRKIMWDLEQDQAIWSSLNLSTNTNTNNNSPCRTIFQISFSKCA